MAMVADGHPMNACLQCGHDFDFSRQKGLYTWLSNPVYNTIFLQMTKSWFSPFDPGDECFQCLFLLGDSCKSAPTRSRSVHIRDTKLTFIGKRQGAGEMSWLVETGKCLLGVALSGPESVLPFFSKTRKSDVARPLFSFFPSFSIRKLRLQSQEALGF